MDIKRLDSNSKQNFTAQAIIKCNNGRRFPKALINTIENEAHSIGNKHDSISIQIGSTKFWKSENGPKQGYDLSIIFNIKNKIESISKTFKKQNKVTPEMQTEDIISIMQSIKK